MAPVLRQPATEEAPSCQKPGGSIVQLRPCAPPPRYYAPARPSGFDRLPIGGLPAPCTRAVAAFHHALLVDLGDDFAVAGQQRLGRAHLGAERQLALGQTVRPIFIILLLAAVGL